MEWQRLFANYSKQFSQQERILEEKDFQQIRIIQEMVKQENLDVEIVPMPIHRADSGLAFSSRNARLSTQQTSDAPQIYSDFIASCRAKK